MKLQTKNRDIPISESDANELLQSQSPGITPRIPSDKWLRSIAASGIDRFYEFRSQNCSQARHTQCGVPNYIPNTEEINLKKK